MPNCSFVSNQDWNGDIFVLVGGYNAEFQRCLFAYNSTLGNPVSFIRGSVQLDSCLIFQNYGSFETALQEEIAKPTNIVADPVLCFPTPDQLSVKLSSPCLPQNNELSVLIGDFDRGGPDAGLDSLSLGCDNCPEVYNPDQLDENCDGFGDVCDGLVHIYSGILPQAQVNQPYEHHFKVIGGVPPYDWKWFGGDLPPGLAIDYSSNASIAGIPSAISEFTFSISIEDSSVPPLSDTAAYFITVGFLCGDVNFDATVSVADAVYIINFIFNNGEPPMPAEVGDADGNGFLTITDAVIIIYYIFGGGPAPCDP